MKQINLLPWREQLRENQKRQFFQALGVTIALALLFLLLAHVIQAERINTQEYRNHFLKQEILSLDGATKQIHELQMQKAQLHTRMAIIHDLQAERVLSVAIFDELARLMPNGIYLTSIKREADLTVITGKAESNSAVSLLMRHIASSKWLHNPILNEIKTNPAQQLPSNDFTLQIKDKK